MISLRIALSPEAAVAKLVEAIAAAPLALVAHINGQANAAKRGLQVPADQVLEVFRPDLAVRVWRADRRAGIDIPLRIHVYEQDGATVVAHRPPAEVFAAYANPALDEVARDLAPLLARVLAPLQPFVRPPMPVVLERTPALRRWICKACDYAYDEALGAPEEGAAPGTRFEDLGEDWFCPDCGVGKSDFVPMDR